MKLTSKTQYGIRAMVHIASKYDDKKPVSRKEIGDKQNIPASYLENILIILKKSGLIKTVRGPKGGFFLTRSPSEINMYDLFSSLNTKSETKNKTQDCEYCIPILNMEETVNAQIKELLQKESLADQVHKTEEQVGFYQI